MFYVVLIIALGTQSCTSLTSFDDYKFGALPVDAAVAEQPDSALAPAPDASLVKPTPVPQLDAAVESMDAADQDTSIPPDAPDAAVLDQDAAPVCPQDYKYCFGRCALALPVPPC